jgi:peptide deformylase
MAIVNPCPCGSNKEYALCCKPFHQGAPAENALLLMRSRYSAYVLNLPDYIVKTTHPANPQYSDHLFSWKRSISKFSKKFSFHSLEILDFKEKNALATVTFTVHMSQGGRDATFTEKSYFEKMGSLWLYRSGQLEEGYAPNFVTAGLLRLLPLAYYGDSVLRKKAEPLTEITKELKDLVEEMIETMEACDGMGLAAPQVHHSIRLFIICAPIEIAPDQIELGEIKVFINPKILSSSEETWETPEGCLSIPSLRCNVKRPKEITVEYLSLDGSLRKERFTGWEARAILHEYDHIEGILFIDRIDPQEQTKFQPFLQNLEKRIHDGRAL